MLRHIRHKDDLGVNTINQLIDEINAARNIHVSGGMYLKKGKNCTMLSGGGISVSAGVGGGIRNAFCKVAAGSGATIVCYLGIDGDGSAAWDVETEYNIDSTVTHSETTWRSTQAENTGNEPGVDEGWVDIEITVTCTLIEAANLSACFPTLAVSTMMPVWKDGETWRSLWWFQGHEECP